MKLKRALVIFFSALAALIILLLLAYLILLGINPNKERPVKIDDATGYVKASGTNLYDGDGNLLQLKGVNLGNWFIQEFWMGASAVSSDYETGIYTQLRGDAAMRSNPNLTEEQIAQLNALYLDTYIQESDFEIIASLGMNVVRIPFTWFNLTTDGSTLRENAFEKLDWAVSMCEKYGLYAILDLHGAVGSQNQDFHSGDDAQFHLYDSEENMARTCSLWEQIAEHYKGSKTVAAYDLLNEPRRAVGKFGGKINFDFYDRLYKTVRAVDADHLIMIECFSFPVNGARLNGYDWENICMEYHIYNHTPLSQKTCLNFYKVLHNFMRFRTPVYIGEWNAFEKESEWRDSFAWFDQLGWSFTSWTYKADKYIYQTRFPNFCNWGLYELNLEPVELDTATYEEIAETYAATATKPEDRTVVYDLWEAYLKGGK